MHTTKRASFQGQIETVLRMSLSDLDLLVKKLFPVLPPTLLLHQFAAGPRDKEAIENDTLLLQL